MKTRLAFSIGLFLSFSLLLSAKDVDERILDMQLKFVKCVETNDSVGAIRVADSLKSFALKNKRLKVYYYCYNNLVKMECLRGKYHEAIHLSQNLLADIQKRKAFDYMAEYHKCMSTIHSARGDLKQSLECLLKAEEKSKGEDKNIYIRLASLLIDMNKPLEAIKWAEKAEKESSTDILKSNGIYYKMYAYYKTENKDSFDVYYNKFVDIAKQGHASPEHLPYLPYMRNFMDCKYNEAIRSACNIKLEKDRLDFMIQAYIKEENYTKAFDLQSRYIKLKDSINELIVHEDLLALNHSSEIAEKNNELAKHRYTNMILAIVIGISCVAGLTWVNLTRKRFIKRLKQNNEQLRDAINEVEKSARIRRAMIEDVKDKSNQPQNVLRTYSRIIINPDFNLSQTAKSEVLPNIRKSAHTLSALSSALVNMYKNDEQAQQIDTNGKTKIENSRNELTDSINSLSGFLDIMEASNYNIDDCQMTEIALQMHLDMKSITILFDTMLDMAYYDSFDNLPLEDNIHVNEICQTLITEFIQRHKEDVAIKFSTKLDDNVTIMTHYNALYKMLKYTLDNADKFTSKGTIDVECSSKGDNIIISFTDTGCGITEDMQEKVFERFFRTKCAYHGVGLGLPICKKIGSLIKANIYLDKEYKQGCRFIIEI